MDYFNMGAAKGRMVGQGLMATGQIIGGAIQNEKEKQLKQTMAILSMGVEMGKNLKPEDQMRLYTAEILPMLFKIGAVKDADKKKFNSLFANISMLSKEGKQALIDKFDTINRMIDEGNIPEATKKMLSEADSPMAQPFIQQSQKEIERRRGIEKEQREEQRGIRKEERAVGRKLKGGLLAGDIARVPEGERERYEEAGKPVVEFEGQGLFAGQSRKEKLQEKINEEKALMDIEQTVQLSEADKERIRLQHENAMKQLRARLGAQRAKEKEKQVRQVTENLLANSLRKLGVYKDKEKGWVRDVPGQLGTMQQEIVDASPEESLFREFETELLRRVKDEPDRAVRDIANEMIREIEDEISKDKGEPKRKPQLEAKAKVEKRKPEPPQPRGLMSGIYSMEKPDTAKIKASLRDKEIYQGIKEGVIDFYDFMQALRERTRYKGK